MTLAHWLSVRSNLFRRRRTPLTSVENSNSITTLFFVSSQIITRKRRTNLVIRTSSAFLLMHNSEINGVDFNNHSFVSIRKNSSSSLCMTVITFARRVLGRFTPAYQRHVVATEEHLDVSDAAIGEICRIERSDRGNGIDAERLPCR